MSSQTTNLHLVKPAGGDTVDIDVINGNMDTLDAKVGAVGNTSLQAQVTALGESVKLTDLTKSVQVRNWGSDTMYLLFTLTDGKQYAISFTDQGIRYQKIVSGTTTTFWEK